MNIIDTIIRAWREYRTTRRFRKVYDFIGTLSQPVPSSVILARCAHFKLTDRETNTIMEVYKRARKSMAKESTAIANAEKKG